MRIKEETEIIEGEVVEIEIDRPATGSVLQNSKRNESLPICASLLLCWHVVFCLRVSKSDTSEIHCRIFASVAAHYNLEPM